MISISGDFPGCNYSAVPGFLSTQLPFTSSFQRIDLERYPLSAYVFYIVCKVYVL